MKSAVQNGKFLQEWRQNGSNRLFGLGGDCWIKPSDCLSHWRVTFMGRFHHVPLQLIETWLPVLSVRMISWQMWALCGFITLSTPRHWNLSAWNIEGTKFISHRMSAHMTGYDEAVTFAGKSHKEASSSSSSGREREKLNIIFCTVSSGSEASAAFYLKGTKIHSLFSK